LAGLLKLTIIWVLPVALLLSGASALAGEQASAFIASPAAASPLQHTIALALSAITGLSVPADAPAFSPRQDKVVIVVGPVDPPINQRTNAYIAEAKVIAKIMERAGYRVVRLFHPNATWEKLRAAGKDADLLIYYGHGNGYGWEGMTENSAINGFCLTDPAHPDIPMTGPGIPGGNGEQLRVLQLAAGSMVVMVHACYASGSSQSDKKAVAYEVANQRVAGYADTFFRAGAGYYLATNFVGAAPDYFQQLVGGSSPREAFLKVMGGARTYSSTGMLLVEDKDAPNDPYPWVSAMVEKSVQLALAPAPDNSSAQDGKAAAKQQ
jgi:hypothetical protein